jgi:protein-S-isoprenylcysteine O-methyltransferase Ste14
MVMALRHILSILILPFTVTVLVPLWLTKVFAALDSHWDNGSALTLVIRALGIGILFAGLVLFAWCVSLFWRIGKGTLAPWDPTKKLVAIGPYRWIRNPMITGVATILTGEAVLLGSWVIATWAALFVVINHLYFVFSEEPGLEKRFGTSYIEYKRSVPRWFPSLSRPRQPNLD